MAESSGSHSIIITRDGAIFAWQVTSVWVHVRLVSETTVPYARENDLHITSSWNYVHITYGLWKNAFGLWKTVASPVPGGKISSPVPSLMCAMQVIGENALTFGCGIGFAIILTKHTNSKISDNSNTYVRLWCGSDCGVGSWCPSPPPVLPYVLMWW